MNIDFLRESKIACMSKNSLSRVSDKKVYVVEGDTSVFRLPDGCVVGIEGTNEEKTTISYLDARSNDLYVIDVKKTQIIFLSYFAEEEFPIISGELRLLYSQILTLKIKMTHFIN